MTKSCRPAELDEGQAKHQSRPVDERAAAAAAGRFIDVPPDLSTPPTGPSPYQGRAPPCSVTQSGNSAAPSALASPTSMS